jgi:hypothetical protein
MRPVPLHPKNPERVCWGCDRYCPSTDLACGNGTIRTMHPVELFGDDWLEWSASRSGSTNQPAQTTTSEQTE